MGMEIRFLIEPLVTIGVRADKRFFSCVNPHVSFQIKVKRESFVAKMALVWFFTLKSNLRNEIVDLNLPYGQACAF